MAFADAREQRRTNNEAYSGCAAASLCLLIFFIILVPTAPLSSPLLRQLLRELKRVRQIAFGYWGSMAPASHARDFDHARWYSLSASTAGYG